MSFALVAPENLKATRSSPAAQMSTLLPIKLYLFSIHLVVLFFSSLANQVIFSAHLLSICTHEFVFSKKE